VTTLWPRESLSSAIQQRKEFIQIDDLDDYKRCRVQLHAEGIVLRDTVSGAEIKTKKQQVCKAGDFLVAEIDAKVGGFGIVPDELDGAIVSSHYFLFEVNERKLDRRFLDFFIRTPEFKNQVMAQGSTNYAAIRPADVLEYKVSLPPLPEQCRIVARIEELAAKISEAQGLRQNAEVEAEALYNAKLHSAYTLLAAQYGLARLDQLIVDAVYGSSEKCYPERVDAAIPVLRIPNLASERIRFGELKYAQLSQPDQARLLVKFGDLLVVRTNGSLDLVGRSAVVNDLPEPMAFASYLIRLRFDEARILPEYAQRMLRHLRTAGELIDFARTTAGQYNVSLGRLRLAEIPVPPLSEQHRIVAELDAMQAQVDALKRLQAETAAELDAMLPSILDKAFNGNL
jgi:type I restriction enzyme S subunit